MQHLNTLWQLVNVASTIRDIAQHTKTYTFAVGDPITFYLQAENAEVRVSRWLRPQVEVTVRLQASFGWRIATDQDVAGVYVVAKRRPVVGNLARAAFDVIVPPDTHLILKLDDGRITLENVTGTLQIPPDGALTTVPDTLPKSE